MLRPGNVQERKVFLCDAETIWKVPLLFLNREEHVVAGIVEYQREARMTVQEYRKTAVLLGWIAHEFVGKQSHGSREMEVYERVRKGEQSRTKHHRHVRFVGQNGLVIVIKHVGLSILMVKLECISR